MNKLKVAFFGTPDITIPSLELLNDRNDIELHTIVTMPDRPAGRGNNLKSPIVAEFAKKHNINLIQSNNINKDIDKLDNDFDLIIVFAFSQFLNSKILDLPKLGCFNIHTSLLPKYRGAAPIQYALLNGDKSTGVSIQKMVKKMDAGDIAHSLSIEIKKEWKAPELYEELKTLSQNCLNEFLNMALKNSISFKTQDESQVSFAPTIKKTDGFIDFKSSTRNDVLNKLRAFMPWPGIYCFLNKKRLKIFEIESEPIPLDPGYCSTDFGSLAVGVLDGTLRLKEIQIEGKKACSDSELINGLKSSNTDVIINPE